MRKYINTNWLFYCVLFVILSSIVQTFGKPRGEDDDGERESEIVHEQQLEATGSGEHVDIHHEEYTQIPTFLFFSTIRKCSKTMRKSQSFDSEIGKKTTHHVIELQKKVNTMKRATQDIIYPSDGKRDVQHLTRSQVSKMDELFNEAKQLLQKSYTMLLALQTLHFGMDSIDRQITAILENKIACDKTRLFVLKHQHTGQDQLELYKQGGYEIYNQMIKGFTSILNNNQGLDQHTIKGQLQAQQTKRRVSFYLFIEGFYMLQAMVLFCRQVLQKLKHVMQIRHITQIPRISGPGQFMYLLIKQMENYNEITHKIPMVCIKPHQKRQQLFHNQLNCIKHYKKVNEFQLDLVQFMLHLDMVISNNKKLLVACKKMLIHKTSVMQKEVGNHVNEFRSFNMDGLRQRLKDDLTTKVVTLSSKYSRLGPHSQDLEYIKIIQQVLQMQRNLLLVSSGLQKIRQGCAHYTHNMQTNYQIFKIPKVQFTHQK